MRNARVYLTPQELSDVTGIGKQTLYGYAKHYGMPYVGPASSIRRMRFYLPAVLEWLRKKESSKTGRGKTIKSLRTSNNSPLRFVSANFFRYPAWMYLLYKLIYGRVEYKDTRPEFFAADLDAIIGRLPIPQRRALWHYCRVFDLKQPLRPTDKEPEYGDKASITAMLDQYFAHRQRISGTSWLINRAVEFIRANLNKQEFKKRAQKLTREITGQSRTEEEEANQTT